MSKRDLIYGSLILLIIILIWSTLRFFVFTPIKINNTFMQPFLMKDEQILTSKLTKVKRFDVVAFSDSNHPKQTDVKRVIGLPGDEVHFMDDILYINGNVVDEPYLEGYKQKLVDGEPFTPDFNLEQLFGISKIPKDKFFVLGDNRRADRKIKDQRLIEKEQIIGEAKFAFWPVKFFGPITNSVEDSSAEIDLAKA